MPASSAHFEEFEAHTRLKHLILESYLKAWARKLLLRPKSTKRVYFVDACAGVGMDEAGNSGSPVIAARELTDATRQLTHLRPGEDFSGLTIAIEKHPRRYQQLKANLEAFGDRAVALQGTLSDHLGVIERDIGAHPALFFIDPFGIEPLNARAFAAILGHAHWELFALFADSATLRHFGLASIGEPERSKTEQVGLFDAVADLVAVDEPPEELPDDLARGRERSIEIMDAAFGSHDWYEVMDKGPRGLRRQAVIEHFESKLYGWGALRVLTIPIRSDANRHVYHLLYATKSRAGYVAMKEAVSYALRHPPVSQTAANVMRFAVRSNLRRVATQVRAHFAGQTVSWKEKLRPYVLENTEAYDFELQELKDLIQDWKLRGRSLVYRFPS